MTDYMTAGREGDVRDILENSKGHRYRLNTRVYVPGARASCANEMGAVCLFIFSNVSTLTKLTDVPPCLAGWRAMASN